MEETSVEVAFSLHSVQSTNVSFTDAACYLPYLKNKEQL